MGTRASCWPAARSWLHLWVLPVHSALLPHSMEVVQQILCHRPLCVPFASPQCHQSTAPGGLDWDMCLCVCEHMRVRVPVHTQLCLFSAVYRRKQDYLCSNNCVFPVWTIFCSDLLFSLGLPSSIVLIFGAGHTFFHLQMEILNGVLNNN